MWKAPYALFVKRMSKLIVFFLDCPEFKEYFDFIGHNLQLKIIKAWRSCPRLLAEHYCFHLESGVTFLFIANDSETDNSVASQC